MSVRPGGRTAADDCSSTVTLASIADGSRATAYVGADTNAYYVWMAAGGFIVPWNGTSGNGWRNYSLIHGSDDGPPGVAFNVSGCAPATCGNGTIDIATTTCQCDTGYVGGGAWVSGLTYPNCVPTAVCTVPATTTGYDDTGKVETSLANNASFNVGGWACADGFDGTAEALTTDQMGSTALHWAAFAGNADVVRLLATLAHGGLLRRILDEQEAARTGLYERLREKIKKMQRAYAS